MCLLLIILGMLLSHFTHNKGRKEMNDMVNDDSKDQIRQEKEDKPRQGNNWDTNRDGNFDKKLDGPNRPAE
jgi:hypothetical protein